MNKIDYSIISSNYDLRYKVNSLSEISSYLAKIAGLNSIKGILEIGCGTGTWLKSISISNKFLAGLDYSRQMLSIAKSKNLNVPFINADANLLPLKKNSIDFIFCINSFHFINNKEMFINNVKNTLANQGYFLIITVEPLDPNDSWYVYDFFNDVFEYDCSRFIPISKITELLSQNNFNITENVKVVTIENSFIGEQVFNDSFLIKNQTSQLASISLKNYELGIDSIKKQIAINPHFKFLTRLTFKAILSQLS